MRSRTNPHRARLAAVSALALLVTFAAACGSDDNGSADDGDAVASLRDIAPDTADDTADDITSDASGEPGDGSASDGELEAPDDPEEAFALYDQCLQDHGVDPGQGFVVAGDSDAIAVAPAEGAPANGADGGDQVFVFGEGDGPTPPDIDQDFLDAMEACRGHLANATPDFELTPEQEAAMEDAQLAFQQCMTEHGIEGGGFSISVGAGAAIDVQEAPDTDTEPTPREVDPEEFQAAAEDCQTVYEDYPELDDVFPGGGPGGGFVTANNAAGGGS